MVHGLLNNWITICCLLCVSSVGAEDPWTIKFMENRLPGGTLMSVPQDFAETFVRRLAFDLTGLPPTLEESRCFVHYKSYQACGKKVGCYLQAGAPVQFQLVVKNLGGRDGGANTAQIVKQVDTLPVRNAAC